MQLLRAAILFSILSVASYSCKKKAQPVNNNPVPSVAVQITIYPNDPLYHKLQAIGGWQYIEGGINGIVLYRKSNEEFVAVERTSPDAPNDPKSKVWVQSDNFTLKDSVSGSTWQIFDGAVIKGPAKWPLRLYGTVYSGNSLAIRN